MLTKLYNPPRFAKAPPRYSAKYALSPAFSSSRKKYRAGRCEGALGTMTH
jgi:hypothetical protein